MGKKTMGDTQEPKTDDVPSDSTEEKQEEEVLKETSDDEVRSSVIERYELDEDSDEDLIKKITEREKEQRSTLGKAIEQKRGWREKATQKPKEQPKAQGEPQDIEKLLDQKFEERELQSSDLPDDLKEEARKIAQVKEIPMREAIQDPYILHRKGELEREERVAKATPRRSKKGTAVSNIDPSKSLNPEDFDMNSEEGVKEWKEAKRARQEYRNNQS